MQSQTTITDDFPNDETSIGEKDIAKVLFPVDANEEDIKIWLLVKKNLLRYKKVFRDAPHRDRDIWLTELEVEIIDLPIFQRLRGLKQLGTTHLVYPCAVHTRFEHSLGTLHVAQKIVDAVNTNYLNFEDGEHYINPEENLIIRLVALLHDVAHLPFGHTLEDEGKLFGNKKQWADELRKETISNHLKQIIVEKVKTVFIETGYEDIAVEKSEEYYSKIMDVLEAEESGEPKIKSLNLPFMADIVGDTICADLLDYVNRDMFFSGLSSDGFDYTRLIKFFIIEIMDRKPRLVLKLYKNNDSLRLDLLSDILDLLRKRYLIAEKLYYHHAKIVTSAMIIEMMELALKSRIFSVHDSQKERTKEVISKLSFKINEDSDLLNYLIQFERPPEGSPEYFEISSLERTYENAAKETAHMLKTRVMFKPVFMITYSDIVSNPIEEFTQMHEDWEKRFSQERYWEELLSLAPGNVIIYSPKQDMGDKQAEAKVKVSSVSDTIYSFKELGEQERYEKIVENDLRTLSDKYKSLWKLYVLIHPAQLRDAEGQKKAKLLAGISRKLFGDIPSRIQRFKDVRAISEATAYAKARNITTVDSLELDDKYWQAERAIAAPPSDIHGKLEFVKSFVDSQKNE